MNLIFNYLVCVSVSFLLFACSEKNIEKSTEETPKELTLYVSPNGTDSAKGDINSPFSTLPQAVAESRKRRQAGYSKPITL